MNEEKKKEKGGPKFFYYDGVSVVLYRYPRRYGTRYQV